MGIDKGLVVKCRKIAFLRSYLARGQGGQGGDSLDLSPEPLNNYPFSYIYPSFFIIILKGIRGTMYI